MFRFGVNIYDSQFGFNLHAHDKLFLVPFVSGESVSQKRSTVMGCDEFLSQSLIRLLSVCPCLFRFACSYSEILAKTKLSGGSVRWGHLGFICHVNARKDGQCVCVCVCLKIRILLPGMSHTKIQT